MKKASEQLRALAAWHESVPDIDGLNIRVLQIWSLSSLVAQYAKHWTDETLIHTHDQQCLAYGFAAAEAESDGL